MGETLNCTDIQQCRAVWDFPRSAGEMSARTKGVPTIPPPFAQQKGDASSKARRRGFIPPHPRIPHQSSQPIIQHHRDHSSKEQPAIPPVRAFLETPLPHQRQRPTRTIKSTPQGVPSPFCAAKGGRVERSKTQGVHTTTPSNTTPIITAHHPASPRSQFKRTARPPVGAFRETPLPHQRQRPRRTIKSAPRGAPSPFCAAKGGRVERSKTQGVHTIALPKHNHHSPSSSITAITVQKNSSPSI